MDFVLGRLGGLIGQGLDLGSHDREALARLASARCLDGGIERQQVGLLGDIRDQANHVANLLRRFDQALNLRVGPVRLVDRVARDATN